MPSSGYAAITFVANEQPTTAKWNLIGSNDSSFNLGTGLEDSVIITRHLATNAVTGDKLGTAALLAGVATATANFATGSATPVQITGLTKTFTMPAGGRSVLLMFCANDSYNSGAGTAACQFDFWKGTVGTGTLLGQVRPQQSGVPQAYVPTGFVVDVAPAAGSLTYNMGLSTSSAGNNANFDATATHPATFLVMII